MIVDGVEGPVEIDENMIAELKKIAQNLPLPISPFACVSCKAKLYFLGNVIAVDIGTCPVCGKCPVDETTRLNLHAIRGSGTFIQAS